MTIYYQDERVTLHHGDCIEVMRSMPESSVDAVVTDPPYALGFMGRSWDTFGDVGRGAQARTQRATEVTPEGQGHTTSAGPYLASGVDSLRSAGAPFQDWCQQWAREALRVLKPGGHLLAFGGTRTWHRLACAVEDAGFEVRDSIAWLYGCLSDDTEILTSEGWVRYDRATEGQHALAFDTATGALAWQAIQHVHRYPYAGEMVRLHSEHTDQLLTPNHRVVLDEGRPTPHTPYVPSEQDLRRLLADVPGARPLPVGAEADVLAGVRGSADLAAEEGQGQASLGAGRPHGAVRDVRDGDVEAGRLAQADRGGVLLEPMQRRAPGGGVGEALPQGQGGLDRRQPGVLSGEDDRAEQPRMEGRRYRVQEARELRRSALRASAGMGATDGPQGRVHHGAPATDGRPLRVPADPAGSHQPREPRPQGQPTGEPDPLALEPSAQALRVGEDGGGRLLPSTGVTADVVDYAGVVWCITVPHGAFIARRNGLIFATGNSGFPKSLDVSKAIDKAAGAEREASGERGGTACTYLDRGDSCPGHDDAGQSMSGATVHRLPTAPATDAARQWAGFGTALKPAFEPVVVARKPLIGTVAATVLAHGTGALNIDGCRIGLASGEDVAALNARSGGRRGFASEYVGGTDHPLPPGADLSKGRWPANVVLDESQAEALDEQSGERSAGGRPASAGITSEPGAANGTMGGAWSGVDRAEREVLDKGGASRFFFVASHDKGDTSALTGKGGRIESCETASTAAESSSPPRQFGDSALGGAVTSEHPDTASQTGSPSTSATPSGSRPSGRPATPTTQNIDAESSPEQQPGERTPTASPASSVGPSAPTVTTTTTTSPSTSAGSAAPATSDTTSQWKALGDTDSAPFKYVAKADATERPRVNGTAHPTVKPLALMRWLVRLVTPPGGTVLEPFAGSGTTVEACLLEGFRCIAIEKTDEYLSLTVARIYRQRHPVEAVKLAGDDLGLFAHIDEEVTC